MKSKSLSKTNRWVKRDQKSGRFLNTNVASSTAVETRQPVARVVKRIDKLKSSKPAILQKRRAS